MDGDGLHCAHPLHNHFYGDHPSIWTVKDGHRGLCHGCPCHEPEPAKDTQRTDPPNCDWHRDEFGNWFSGCSETMPDFTPWKGTDPNGAHCPKCGKVIATKVHDKP
jgi:hypothetical protein